MRFEKISAREYKKYWEKFTEKNPGNYTFLQSPKFGIFREQLGEKIFYTVVKHQDGDISMLNLVQVIESGWKKWLHVPHMNVGKEGAVWNLFLEGLKNLGKNLGCDLVRVSPLVELAEPSSEKNPPQSPFNKGEEFRNILRELGFRGAAVHLVNPEKTWVLDITGDEEGLIAGMDKKHRSDLRRGIKKGVVVECGNDFKHLDVFWDLHMETVRRHGFVPFSRRSTEVQLEVFGEDCLIFNGGVDGEYFSSAVVLFDNDQAYYHQGASLSSNIPVSNVVLWEAIREAKRRGCKVFNFWGVSDIHDKKHPWSGLSRFKRKFGGYEINYLHCHDFPLTWKYYVNFLLEKWRRWRRGY